MSKKVSRGFTLIELLVVIAIIALLISVLLPALSAAKREGQKAKCNANLRSVAQASVAYSTDDPDTKIIPEHPDSLMWNNEGYWDWGGNDGKQGTQWGSDDPFGGSYRRPLNKIVAGSSRDLSGTGQVNEAKGFEIYNCPADAGFITTPGFDPGPDFVNTQTFLTTGSSYMANTMRAVGGGVYYSMSPYLRPVTKIPSSAETLIYFESNLWSTPWNSSTSAFGNGPGAGVTLYGWHRQLGKFNVAFCDGHAATVSAKADDYIEPPTYDNLFTRAHDFRFDCRRDPLIEE